MLLLCVSKMQIIKSLRLDFWDGRVHMALHSQIPISCFSLVSVPCLTLVSVLVHPYSKHYWTFSLGNFWSPWPVYSRGAQGSVQCSTCITGHFVCQVGRAMGTCSDVPEPCVRISRTASTRGPGVYTLRHPAADYLWVQRVNPVKTRKWSSLEQHW